jgi:arabinosyltransferase B
MTAVSLFASLFIMLRRKRVPGVARGPVWRLMGIIFGTVFFLMFTPTKWVHHFGLFAAVGAAMAAVATVLVSSAVLRSPRNRMAFTAVVLFLLALCFSTTNGWWYVSSFGVPFNNAMPKVAGVAVGTIFLGLFAITAVWAFWLHFARDRPESRLAKIVTAAPIPLTAGLMVLVFLGSMMVGVVRQWGTYSNASSNLRALTGACGLADDVLVEPDSNDGFLTAAPGNYGPLGPLGGVGPVGFTPNGLPDRIVAESLREPIPKSGTDYDWYGPAKLKSPGINGSTVPLPYGLDPNRVPVAGTYLVGLGQQQSRLTSAWYLLPPPDAAHPLVVVTAAGSVTGNSVFNGHTEGQKVELEWGRTGPDGSFVPGGRVSPYDLGPIPSWRNLRYDWSQVPREATAVRIVAEDLSLTQGEWIAITPPRVPELRTVQEYVGSDQPVLMDWAVGLAFPCQQPMLHNNGVTEIPKYRITPDYNAKRLDTDTWEDGLNGGLLGISDLLLRQHVMSTYLSHDWGRDWGSLRRFDTVVAATPAELTLGTATHSGLYSPGKIRIKP